MRTAIIILNYNTANLTFDCIKSIKENFKTDYKIVVVDNASFYEDRRVLIEKLADEDNIKLILLEKNCGYSGGNNVGVKYAIEKSFDSVLIMNADVIVKNDILSIMQKDLDKNVVWVGPMVLDIDNQDGQHIRKNYSISKAFWSKKPLYGIGRLLHMTADIKTPQVRKVFQGCVSGCCFLMDCSVFEKIGMFDDNVFLYCEEYIIGKKLEKENYKTCYNPDAKVIHLEGKSTNKISNAFVDYHLYASEYYLLNRYCDLKGIKRLIIKELRLLNYFFKSLGDSSYKEKLKVLKNKFAEIENEQYKICY